MARLHHPDASRALVKIAKAEREIPFALHLAQDLRVQLRRDHVRRHRPE
jgi:hypothetical protein